MGLPDLPPPQAEHEPVQPRDRPIAFAAVIGGGISLLAVIVGLILLGLQAENDVSDTGLASIGATLAGGFAGWIARGEAIRHQQHDET